LSLLHPAGEGVVHLSILRMAKHRTPDAGQMGLTAAYQSHRPGQENGTPYRAIWEPSEQTGALGFRLCRSKRMR